MSYYNTGTVTAFAGASGLLQTILGQILGTEVTGENLSGTGAAWSGTLANSPVGLGRLIINYAFSSTNYEGVDDGSGNITGTNISSGSITYSTGAYSITFTGTPDATPTADYIYGNEGQDWRQELNRNTRDNQGAGYTEVCSPCKEVVISNTGLSGQEAVIVGIRECYYVSANFYVWDLNGYTTFNDSGEWDQNSAWHNMDAYSATYNSFTEHPHLPLVDDTMSYWVYSNQQRIVVVVKVSSNYEIMYLGFGRRFGNPGDYPFPLLIGGTTTSTYLYSETSYYHLWPLGSYRQNNSLNVWIIDPGTGICAWEGSFGQNNGPIILPYDAWSNQGALAPTENGERLMTPVYYTPYDDTGSVVWFDLDGVYHIAGTGIQSEDHVNYAGDRYRIFQNCHRTTYYDYCAVLEGAAVSTTTSTTTTSTTTTTT